METRNVTLTLEKAKEFYNSGNAALMEVALQAHTKEELTIPKFENIKTFEDACKYLGLNMDFVNFTPCSMKNIEGGFGKHLIAIYKLDIIRKALNGANWKPSLVKDKVFYPFVRFYLANKAKDDANSNGWKLGPSFMADGEKYTLVSSEKYMVASRGYSYCYGYGIVSVNAGLLGCKSEEIAQHMSKYFMKEIFEVVYAQNIGMYEWV